MKNIFIFAFAFAFLLVILITVFNNSIVNKRENIQQSKVTGVYSLILRDSITDNFEANPVEERSIETPWGTSTSSLPAGSIEIPGYFEIAAVNYNDISTEKPITNWSSCCTATKYSYSKGDSLWSAVEFKQYESDGIEAKDPETPLSLVSSGVCQLEEKFGDHTYYKVAIGDEGVATTYNYYLMTDRGYAIRFTSKYDLRNSHTAYPDASWQTNATSILSTIKLTDGTGEVLAKCR